LLLNDLGILRPGDANPIGHTQDMAVDRESWNTKCVAKDDVGGLASDSRKLNEIVHRLWDVAAVAFNDFSRHAE
jgi:hypothetical protein